MARRGSGGRGNCPVSAFFLFSNCFDLCFYVRNAMCDCKVRIDKGVVVSVKLECEWGPMNGDKRKAAIETAAAMGGLALSYTGLLFSKEV